MQEQVSTNTYEKIEEWAFKLERKKHTQCELNEKNA